MKRATPAQIAVKIFAEIRLTGLRVAQGVAIGKSS